MTKTLFLDDAYMKTCTATVEKVKDKKYIVLDQTIFYPRGGGQTFDTGTIVKGDDTFNVVFCGKFDGQISHEVDKEGLKEGDSVTLNIDWERRYKLMRAHTSAHIMSEVIHKQTGAMMTGNQLEPDKIRIDFSAEEFNKDIAQTFIDTANDVVQKNLPITISMMPRDEAMKLSQVTKLAMGLPKHLTTLRIVSIGDYDIQADGGTHVSFTHEIGTLQLLKIDNKGKNNRRIYYTLE